MLGAGSRILAGGLSLDPRPGESLVDLRRLDALRRVEPRGGAVRVGALVRHAELGPNGCRGAIADAVAAIGGPLVRELGTVGGSLAHADPAGDWPAVALALDASLEVRGRDGARTIPIAAFFVGAHATALRPGELLTHVDLPRLPPGARSAYAKAPHPASGLALAGVAVVLGIDAGRCVHARIAMGGLAATPFRAFAAERLLVGRALTPDVVGEAAAAAGGAFRRQLAADVARRAIERALVRVDAGALFSAPVDRDRSQYEEHA